MERLDRAIWQAKAILCIILTLSLSYWSGGCGNGWESPPAGIDRIDISSDPVLVAALADSAFSVAQQLVIDRAAGEARFSFPDATRELKCKFVETDGAFTVTEVSAATAIGGITIRLNEEQQVTEIVTADGYSWIRPAAWTDNAISKTWANSYERANLSLLDLTQALDGTAVDDGGTTSPPPSNPSGGQGSTILPSGKVEQQAFSPLFYIFGLMASIFLLRAGHQAMMRSIFRLVSAITQGLAGRHFSDSAAFVAGEGVLSIAVGDLNGDGSVDLATANYTARTISVLSNTGSGSFLDPTNLALTRSPSGVKLGDANGDGIPDIFACDGSVRMLCNQGGGSFEAPKDATGLSGPATSLALSSRSGRQDSDVVLSGFDPVGESYAQIVEVGLNSGSGGFSQAARLSVGDPCTAVDTPSGAQLVATGDFNGDGIPDSAAANYSTGGVSLLLGAADGSVGAANTIATAPRPVSIVAADLGGDGHLDLVVLTKYDETSNGSGITILRNRGDATFHVDELDRLSRSGSSVIAADLNGDGRQDLVISSNAVIDGRNAVGLLYNRGHGHFASEQWVTVGDQPSYAVAAGDFNNDGQTDLAVGNSPNVVILLHR